MALAVLLKLTVKKMIQNSLIGLLLHRDESFIPLRIERLSFFNSTFKISSQSKAGSSVSLTLKVLMDHPCDLPSRENGFFFLCSFILNEDSSFEVSVVDLLEASRFFLSQEP